MSIHCSNFELAQLTILGEFCITMAVCAGCLVLLWVFNIYATPSLQCSSDSTSVYSALKVRCSSYLPQSNSSGLRANAGLHTKIWHNKANSLFIAKLAIIVIPLFTHSLHYMQQRITSPSVAQSPPEELIEMPQMAHDGMLL